MEKKTDTFTYTETYEFEVSNGENSSAQEIYINLVNNTKQIELILMPLWNLNNPRYSTNAYYKEKFKSGDYFIQTIKTKPVGKGLGNIAHDFLIANRDKFPFLLRNVYSTFEEEDQHPISVGACQLWESRIRKGLAFKDELLSRYKIVW